jgi:ParB family transcriptional regulator, chromosome partitioning protein
VPSITLTIDQIAISPFNVRIHKSDAEDTVELQASIMAEGLINPITVHALAFDDSDPAPDAKRQPTLWGAVAGGRRSHALRQLIQRGDLPPGFPIRCMELVGLSDAELIEASITENLQRRDLRDYEMCAGIARAVDAGHNIEQVAKALAQSDPARVAQWLRLGRLAEPVFKAYATGRLSNDQARAYAATEDRELQAVTFARLSQLHDWQHEPQRIRTAMNIGNVERENQLRFVGEAEYRAAGGRYELDLFAEDGAARGRVCDEGLLSTLVETKLGEIREELRVATGWGKDLRFQPEPPQNDYGNPDSMLEIRPETGKPLKLPQGDVVAVVKIGDDGFAHTSFWWASKKAKYGNGSTAGNDPTPAAFGPLDRARIAPGAALGNAERHGARGHADAALKGDHGLSQDAIEIARDMRRALLRALLVTDADTGGTLANDYLIWSQLRMLYASDSSSMTGMNRLPTDTIGRLELMAKSRSQIEASGVRKACDGALEILAFEAFMTERDPATAFLAFVDAPDRAKRLAAALVAGAALVRSLNADGYRCPVHDALAEATAIAAPDTIRYTTGWQPTEAWIGLFPKSAKLAIAATIDDQAPLRWQGLRNDQLTERVTSLVADTADWLHPLLQFDHSQSSPSTCDGEVAVAQTTDGGAVSASSAFATTPDPITAAIDRRKAKSKAPELAAAA